MTRVEAHEFRPAAAADGLRLGAAAGWWSVAGMVLAIGVGLRLVGARGDLWLDEIWTLKLLEPVTSAGQILWRINHDNNHFLNSFYLYFVGADASPTLQRALSVAAGSAGILAAGLVVRRKGWATAFAAMLLFAVAYPLVHYGSEARGYSGLLLFSLLALVMLEREVAAPAPLNRHALGVAIAFGLLSHLTMAATATTLAAWAAWIAFQRTGRLRAAEAITRETFRPALVWATVIAVPILYGALRHGFTIGGSDRFEAGQIVAGYGDLVRLLLGLPEQVPAWSCLAGAALVVSLAAYCWRGRDDFHGGLYLFSVIGLPAVLFVSRVPNLQYGRYLLFSGAMLLLLVAELFGAVWRRGGIVRAAAAVALLAIVTGNAVSLHRFFVDGRGHYRDAVAAMAMTGSFTYGTDSGFRVPMVIDFYGRRLGVSARNVPAPDWCRAKPDWLVVEDPDIQRTELRVGAPGCAVTYRFFAVYPAWGLSGSTWTLYRRE